MRSGRVNTGVAAVESMPSAAPPAWAMSATAAMSVMFQSGLPGVSIQTSFVSGFMAARTAARSAKSTRSTL